MSTEVWWLQAYRPMMCVYRAFDADGVLLYVGCTHDFDIRRGQHMKDAIWRGQVARWRCRWYWCRWAARDAEREAIRTEHPRWNIINRSKSHPDGWLRSQREVAAVYPDGLLIPETPAIRSRYSRLVRQLGGVA